MVPMGEPSALVIRYSFHFRYQPERVHSVDIPVERLVGVSVDLDALWEFLVEDTNADLFSLLLGNDLPEYRRMYEQREHYWKDIIRFSETAVITAG